LLALAKDYGYADPVVGPDVAEADGFLAVNSILATCLSFARAYRCIAGSADPFPGNYSDLLAEALQHRSLDDITKEIREWGGVRAISVLLSPDLEADGRSKKRAAQSTPKNRRRKAWSRLSTRLMPSVKLVRPSFFPRSTKAGRCCRRSMTMAGFPAARWSGQERVSAAYIYSLLRLPWLAPDITTSIIDGRHPPQLTAKQLMRLTHQLPVDWTGQRKLLGFRPA
jgi:hypothetical protein